MTRYHGLLLAAGKGTRLGRPGDAVPKALVRVGDETLVEHNLRRLTEVGLEHIVVVVGHQADAVVAHLAKHPHRDCLEFVRQEECLGTGHAVAVSRAALRSDPFVLCYCDNFTPYPLGPLVRLHEEQHNVVTLALFRAEDPTRHGIMQVEGRRITGIVERPKEPVGNLAFAGMGVFESGIYDAVQAVHRADSGEYYLTDAMMDLVRTGQVVGFDVLSSWRVNVNSPADLERAWNLYLAHRPV